MKELLVLGGNGFVGSYLVSAGLARGYRVTSVSRGRSTFMIPLNQKDVRQLHVELTDAGAVKSALADTAYTHVINGSGYVDHTLFFKGGRKVIEQHFGGLLNVLEALKTDALEAFVQIGSSDEYGSAPAPQNEGARESPISPYSFSKVAGAHLLQSLAKTEGFPASVVRIFLSYGPGQAVNRFFPQIIQGCLANSSFPVSEGQQLRDFCYIEDVADGIFSALENPRARGEIINIASGKPVTIRTMIETVRDLIGQGTPEFGKVAYRPGENMKLYADVEKAKTLLGWSAATSLEEGLRKTIEYYKAGQA